MWPPTARTQEGNAPVLPCRVVTATWFGAINPEADTNSKRTSPQIPNGFQSSPPLPLIWPSHQISTALHLDFYIDTALTDAMRAVSTVPIPVVLVKLPPYKELVWAVTPALRHTRLVARYFTVVIYICKYSVLRSGTMTYWYKRKYRYVRYLQYTP
jgi:hypothetical protein